MSDQPDVLCREQCEEAFDTPCESSSVASSRRTFFRRIAALAAPLAVPSLALSQDPCCATSSQTPCCEAACQDCQSGCESCQGCQTTCEVYGEDPCAASSQNACEYSCQYCQTPCQVYGESGCGGGYCTGYCEEYCEEYYEYS
jgi:hypothetical protein